MIVSVSPEAGWRTTRVKPPGLALASSGTATNAVSNAVEESRPATAAVSSDGWRWAEDAECFEVRTLLYAPYIELGRVRHNALTTL